MKKWLQRVTAVLIGLFLFFVIGEVGYRGYIYIFKPLHRPSEIPGLLWEPTPGADVAEEGVRYTINSKGLRDYEYSIKKTEGVYRIAVIGDSVTWGYAELKDTYPKIMEKELKDVYPRKKIEVLNFGIEGTGSRNHLAILRERVLQYNPDLVILGHCLNDLLNDARMANIGPVTLWVLRHSYFADFIAVKTVTFARVLRAKAGVMTEEKYYRDSTRLYEEPSKLSALRGILSEMNNLSKNSGINFAVVALPFKQQFNPGASLLPQKKLSEISLNEGILFFDPLNELKGYDKDELYLKGDPIHFSSRGNEVLARSISGFLLSRGLLFKVEGAMRKR